MCYIHEYKVVANGEWQWCKHGMYVCSYMHIMHVCMSNAAKSFSWSWRRRRRRQKPPPCLLDMQRRLNSLMNSQVTRGLD